MNVCPRHAGQYRVCCDVDLAVRAVLETDRHREPRCHLAMDLGFGRAGADRGPAHQIGQIVRRRNVQHLGRDRQPERVDVAEQPARGTQPLLDPVAAIEPRAVDQPFPADRRAGLLEVDAHDYEQRIAHRAGEPGQTMCVIARGNRIMDRARPDDDDPARVAPLENRTHLGTPRIDGRPRGIRRRHRVAQRVGRGQPRADAQSLRFAQPRERASRALFGTGWYLFHDDAPETECGRAVIRPASRRRRRIACAASRGARRRTTGTARCRRRRPARRCGRAECPSDRFRANPR